MGVLCALTGAFGWAAEPAATGAPATPPASPPALVPPLPPDPAAAGGSVRVGVAPTGTTVRGITNRLPTVTAVPGTPLLRPPPALARPPETPYATPTTDPTYVPGLLPGPVNRGLVGPSPVIRPGMPAALGQSLGPGGGGFTTSPRTQDTVLAWDGLVKEVTLKPGETKAYFTFSFTNTSPDEVIMTAVRTSCGCTTAKVPRLPWRLPGGTNASFDVVVDVAGKSGVVTKTVTTETSAGYRYLTTRVTVPATGVGAMAADERTRNIQVALADRQAVLKGECAVCHVTPGVGKQGQELYDAVCGVCHEAEHRASMVPNLRAMNKPFRAEDWRQIIREGRKDSLMPAFAVEHAGVLTDAQIESLVTYLTGPFKSGGPAVSQRAPVPARASPAPPPPVVTPGRPTR